MTPTPKLVEELARSCRIQLTPAECESYARDLCELEALCTPLLEMHGVCSDEYRASSLDQMREDVVGECLPPDTVMALAPQSRDGYIVVPRAIEEGGEV